MAVRNLSLRPRVLKAERFGYNLGFGAKKWIEKFGSSWQFRLAEAIIYPQSVSSDKYKGLNIPRSHEMVKDAEAFLRHNANLHAGVSSTWQAVVRDIRPDYIFKQIEHHTLIEKAFTDTFRFKTIYGNQKVLDPNARSTIRELKDIIRFEYDKKEATKLKRVLKEFEKKTKVRKWELEAEKSGIHRRVDNSVIIREMDKQVKKFEYERWKRITTKDVTRGEIKFEAKYNGRDPGISIGEGTKMNLESDGDRYEQLIRFLKKARWYKSNVWHGIVNPHHKRVKQIIIAVFGRKWYRERFGMASSHDKYATELYYPRRSEYGFFKPYYKKGERTPLQKRLVVSVTGKPVSIRYIPDENDD